MKRCLICDDHEMIRDALQGVIEDNWPEARVLLAEDFPGAWALASECPDLILCDLAMPGADPVEGIGRLRKAAPGAALLVITSSEDNAMLLALYRLGIAGFVPKSSKSAVIAAAIQLILAGGTYIPPAVLEMAGGGPGTHPAANEAHGRLTIRQSEVLKMVAQGQSNKQIARSLDLSPATVNAHLVAAFNVLGATNRTDAVIRARDAGLI